MGEAGRAAGFLLILAPPALLAASVQLGTPWLAFAVLIFGLPLMRPFFGDAEGSTPTWSEPIATLLHGLPLLYAALAPASIGYLLIRLPLVAPSAGALVWWGLSLWATFIFAS